MNLHFVLDDPVCVASSLPDEMRWGVHQFPSLSRLPDGGILLMYSDAPDKSETHGYEAPAFVSRDEGTTWKPYSGVLKVRRPHFTISPVLHGEHLVVAARPYWDMTARPFDLPEPLTESFIYQPVGTYELSGVPEQVRDYFRYLPAERWDPIAGQWQDGTVEYDMRDRILSKARDSAVLPRTIVEQPFTCFDGEIVHADYRSQYLLPDGSVPAKRATYCMVSQDNGRSFMRRSVIAADLQGRDLMAEPTLALTLSKRLVCVIRRTDHEIKPMVITWSDDHGHTWSTPQSLFEFGVFPCLLPLQCGALVLSYGRPGVEMRLSPDGNGESWSAPCRLVPDTGDRKSSCGYTSLLALSNNTFLIAYTDWRRMDNEGRSYKDVLTRRVRVE